MFFKWFILKNRKIKSFLLFIVVFISAFCISSTAFARAGGGGGSGSGGGGGGGSHSSHGSSHSSSQSGPISQLVGLASFIFIGCGGTIILVCQSRIAKRKSVHLMREYQKLGINWDYKEIQAHVEEAYFEIQEAWRRYDTSYASEYLSEELAKRWQTQLEWMKIRNEEIVQKGVRLISAVPVGVHDEAGEEKDQIWYLIHGRMTGYYRNRDTKEVVRGKPRPEDFFEYWLFVRRNGRWVLREIRQKDEMTIDEASQI